jgi:uncharacterized protein YdeI (BOF family)
MNRERAIMMALGVMLSFGMGGCASSDQMASSEGGQPGLRSQTAQEQQERQQGLQRQNIEERNRLEASALKERSGTEIPPYTENQPIGGQQGAGPADFPQPAFPFVKGELMQIEGEFYTLRDAEGKEVRVHVDKGTNMDKGLRIGDIVEVQRTLPGHAVSIKRASGPLAKPPSSASSGMGLGASEGVVKDAQVTMGGAKQAVRGEVLQIDGDNYLIKDGHGNEIRLVVNQNTRILCGPEMTGSGLLPAPSASDKPDAKGQPQDLGRTAEQQGSEVGPGTRSGAGKVEAAAQCRFKKGELIEAEISDMGVATFVKQAGRRQPGQPLP